MNKQVFITLLIVSFSLCSVAAPPAARYWTNAPANLKVSQASPTADGCPQTAYMTLLDGSPMQNLTLLIDNQKLQTRPGFANSSKLCDLSLNLEVPPNLQFAVKRVSAQGFAAVPRGTARASMQLFQVLNPETKAGVSLMFAPLNNPKDDISAEFIFNSEIKDEALVFSNCSSQIQTLNLASQLNINQANPREELYIEAQKYNLNLVWRTCKQ